MIFPISNSTMSAIPPLMAVNPFEEPEFCFPAEDLSWDYSDMDTSDYSDVDTSGYLGSSDSEFELHEALDVSFPPMFYHICHKPEPTLPTNTNKESLIPKLISTIAIVAPTFVYKRRKAAKKRRRKRRIRKRMSAASIEPDLRSLWLNFVDVLPATDPVLPPLPGDNLPTINLSAVNKQMLRRLPDVVNLPVLSCSPDPTFYERNIPVGVHDSVISAFGKDSPFGKLPAIHTDLGPVPPPTDPCYGYVWSEGGWRVQAVRPPVPDPGGGRGQDRREGERGSRGRTQREERKK